jgi:DNA invertase Pin-like site-specific DNA recombinase
MSTDKQEDSPTQQRIEVEKLAKRHGCTIVKEFIDEGISGVDTRKRKGFQEMLRYVQQPDTPKVILSWDQDRFSRLDSVDSGEIIAPLRRAGVRLITVAQGEVDWTTFHGRVIFNLHQEGKNQFLQDLSRNCLRGKIRSVSRGRIVGKIVYAYDREYRNEQGKVVHRVKFNEGFSAPRGWTGKEVPNPEAAPIVKWLFESYADADWSICGLQRNLNERGVPAPAGGPWHSTIIRRILTNPVYVGDVVYGRRRCGKFHRMNDEGDISPANGKEQHVEGSIVVRNAHEAIVSRELFDRVQKRLKERREAKRKPRNASYLLSGMLICGHCGRRLWGRHCSQSDLRYYTCEGDTDKRFGLFKPACKKYSVRKDIIEPFVVNWLLDKALSEENLAKLRVKLLDMATKQAKLRGADQQKALQKQLAALNKQIETGTKNLLLADEETAPLAQKMLAEWRQQRDQVQAQLQGAERSLESPQVRADRAIGQLRKWREGLRSPSEPLRREAIHRTCESITLYWEDVPPKRMPVSRRKKAARRISRGVIVMRLIEGFCAFVRTISMCNRRGFASRRGTGFTVRW